MDIVLIPKYKSLGSFYIKLGTKLILCAYYCLGFFLKRLVSSHWHHG